MYQYANLRNRYHTIFVCDRTVGGLSVMGVIFEKYDGMSDEKGIAHDKAHNMVPYIAWFKDPAGSTLSVLGD